MNLCLGVERAGIVVLILVILVLVIGVGWMNHTMLSFHFIWFLCSIVLNCVLLSAHTENHFVCVLVLRACVVDWCVAVDAYRDYLLLRPLSGLDSLMTGIGLMLAVWNDSNWDVLVCLLLSGLLLFLLFFRLLFALHYDKLVSRDSLTDQVKMQPNQVNQQYGKHANQKRVHPHSHHRPQIRLPLIFRPQQNHPNNINS